MAKWPGAEESFMDFHLNYYSAAMLLSFLIASILSVMAFRQRSFARMRTMGWLMLGLAEWSLGYALELAAVQQPIQIFWAKLEYIGIASVPLFWLLFAMDYANTGGWLRRYFWLLWIEPVVIFLLALTNEFHFLIWNSFNQRTVAGIVALALGHGPAFWVHIAFSYIVLIAGTVLIIRGALAGNQVHRRQAVVVIAGAAMPWLANILYSFGLSPFPGLDLTPLGFILSGLAFSWAVTSYQLLNLMPVAGGVVLQSMRDSVFVLDQGDRLVYLNNAFHKYTGITEEQAIGKTFSEVFSEWPDFVSKYGSLSETRTEFSITFGKQVIIFELSITPLYENTRQAGRVFVLHEITDRKRVEETMQVARTVAVSRTTGLRQSAVFISTVEDQKITDVNNEFVLALGFSKEDVLGLTPLQAGFWSVEQRVAILRVLNAQNEITNLPVKITVRSGGVRDYLLSARPFRIGEDEFRFWVLMEATLTG
jgi:PAS domain S-box-containing protein